MSWSIASIKLHRWGICVVLLLVMGCGTYSTTDPQVASPRVIPREASGGQFSFEDVAAERGVSFTYRNGSELDLCTMLESLGGGVGWLDFDRDGWLDLVATGGGGFTRDKQILGLPAALFHSELGQQFVEVAEESKVQSSALYTCGLAIGDYDNDGFQDVLMTGYGPPQLWRNMGDGTFHNVAPVAGVVDPLWSSSAGWGDLNGDGNLDLYLAHYVNWSFENDPVCMTRVPGRREICAPREYEPLPDTVYFSTGDGSFEVATEFAGLRPDGKGLGVLLADVDVDGDVDIYVANDTTDNFLYLNDGHGRLSERGIACAVALDDRGLPNGSMGIDLCDFNQDGLPDLWVANYEHESFALYRNEGAGVFLHVSQRMGITDLGGLYVGFGTACADFDRDGMDEFVVANGHVLKYPANAGRPQLPLLLKLVGQRYRREEFSGDGYFANLHEGRGLAIADFNRDGAPDVAVSHLNEPLALLENRSVSSPTRTWMYLQLIGTRSPRDAVGARVRVEQGSQRRERQVIGGGSYESHSSRDLQFAFADSELDSTITVYWPSGEVQKLGPARHSGYLTLIEPVGSGPSNPSIPPVEVVP
jgi:hypothetical protein